MAENLKNQPLKNGAKAEELAILWHTDKKRSLFDIGREDRPHAYVVCLW